jgi:hypothetical protein
MNKRCERKAQEVIPMRRIIAAVFTAALMLALAAAPAMAQTTQDGGLINVGNVGVGANVCDVNVLVENDDAAQGQCTNEQNN